ncbi:MAG: hypothetical protein V9G19_08875 [Tetrasphaera sp.]
MYAPTTLGQFVREFTRGHASQLASVARAHSVALAERTPVLAGIEAQAYFDVDSLLGPVSRKTKQGASFGRHLALGATQRRARAAARVLSPEQSQPAKPSQTSSPDRSLPRHQPKAPPPSNIERPSSRGTQPKDPSPQR